VETGGAVAFSTRNVLSTAGGQVQRHVAYPMTFGSSQDAPNDGTTPNNIKDHFFLLEVWVILGAYSAHSMGMLYVMYVMVLIRNGFAVSACWLPVECWSGGGGVFDI